MDKSNSQGAGTNTYGGPDMFKTWRGGYEMPPMIQGNWQMVEGDPLYSQR